MAFFIVAVLSHREITDNSLDSPFTEHQWSNCNAEWRGAPCPVFLEILMWVHTRNKNCIVLLRLSKAVQGQTLASLSPAAWISEPECYFWVRGMQETEWHCSYETVSFISKRGWDLFYRDVWGFSMIYICPSKISVMLMKHFLSIIL